VSEIEVVHGDQCHRGTTDAVEQKPDVAIVDIGLKMKMGLS